jgi:hypothetical protein
VACVSQVLHFEQVVLDTMANAKFDKRTPGLFKVEYTGKSLIGLCPKMYFVEGSDTEEK